MDRRFFTLLAVLAGVLFILTGPTSADERRAWFRSLKQPDSGLGCCDISDCRRTDAEWKQGSWWAIVRGLERPVPHDKVLVAPRSIDGEAYVCATEVGKPELATIYCFIPPNMAM